MELDASVATSGIWLEKLKISITSLQSSFDKSQLDLYDLKKVLIKQTSIPPALSTADEWWNFFS